MDDRADVNIILLYRMRHFVLCRVAAIQGAVVKYKEHLIKGAG